jgi:NAD(P)-dependent dehydrogenase (short-subunit alcohol dehydrogenase family)
MSPHLFDLAGKTALVTGASRGIGAATAQLLARHGAEVVVSSRRHDACEEIVAAITAEGGKARAIAAHIGEVKAIDALFGEIEAQGLRVDLLVNNAAANPYFGPMLHMPLSAYDKTVEVNIRGYFYMTQQAARRMNGHGGAIVNVAGQRPPRGVGAGRVFVFQGRGHFHDGSLGA